MIEIQHPNDQGIIELRMTPPVTDKDYTDTLIPALDAATAGGQRLRLLAVVEAGFSDFTLGAMLQDARTGLRHWRGFDRAAVVTDNAALRTAVRAFSVFMPCPVALFTRAEIEEARRWLRESLGAIHQEDLGNGVLHVRLRGKLEHTAYVNDIEDINRFMAAHDKVRLLIDLREFEGWQDLGAMRDHFALVRGHAPRVERAAVVGDSAWQDVAVAIGKRVFGLDARHFRSEEFNAARAWLTA
ncbi:MAG: hypothetical protein Kow0058_17190 [Roseovarius sp.]